MLSDVIKNLAQSVTDRNMPADVLIGTVTSVDPLTVLVGDKLAIPAAALLLTNAVREHTVRADITPAPVPWWFTETETVIINSNGVTGIGDNSFQSHNHTALEHDHAIVGTKMADVTLKYGLVVDDVVLLLRVSAGQRFVILDRLEALT